jgi:hypothetical protein
MICLFRAIFYKKEKIAKKGCDYLIANDISRHDIGFSSDFNEVYILDKNGEMKKIEKDEEKRYYKFLENLTYNQRVDLELGLKNLKVRKKEIFFEKTNRFRQIIKGISLLENLAATNGLNKIDVKQVKGLNIEK